MSKAPVQRTAAPKRNLDLAVDLALGMNIRRARVERGLTIVELAARVGRTHQQVQKYETGANRVAVSTLYAIARALDAPVTDLLPEPDPAPPGARPHGAVDRRTIDLVQRIGRLPEEARDVLARMVRVLFMAGEGRTP